MTDHRRFHRGLHPLDRRRGSPTGHRTTESSNFHGVPSYEALDAYDVNRPGWEAVRQGVYDFSAITTTMATTYQYFQVQLGQGTTSAPLATGVKTLEDTNMLAAGQFPQNIEYLCESVEIDFYPSTPTPSGSVDMPGFWGVGSLNNTALVNDVYIFRRAGWLIFHIGSKDYLQEAPLSKFPAKTHFHVEGAAADTSTAVTNARTLLQWAGVTGRPYHLAPLSLRLESTQNFNINLNWGAAQTLQNAARAGVRMDGVYYRRSQ